ncbi:MAG TPA: tRNA (adenosine(37)-N6)-threonylcarbamoyltransferase complex ATPase subunit type 1 TsaE [Burkholderiales bacterium]|nr:tRNA (adenosine(37)-N6)-threonylcarbamoyltransferase complex ATPase subunit type 1 TsaE [Burkholderiales bacterium]
MTHLPNHNEPRARAHWTGHLSDEAATLRLGGRLAKCLAPGMRVYLRGELGTGKTTLVRGILRALGYQGRVKSPTYALVELYVVSRLNLYHFDFYRFLDQYEFGDAGLAEYFNGDGDNACVVEWPERAGNAIPPPDLELALVHAGDGRDVNIRANSQTGKRCLTRLRNG